MMVQNDSQEQRIMQRLASPIMERNTIRQAAVARMMVPTP